MIDFTLFGKKILIVRKVLGFSQEAMAKDLRAIYFESCGDKDSPYMNKKIKKDEQNKEYLDPSTFISVTRISRYENGNNIDEHIASQFAGLYTVALNNKGYSSVNEKHFIDDSTTEEILEFLLLPNKLVGEKLQAIRNRYKPRKSQEDFGWLLRDHAREHIEELSDFTFPRTTVSHIETGNFDKVNADIEKIVETYVSVYLKKRSQTFKKSKEEIIEAACDNSIMLNDFKHIFLDEIEQTKMPAKKSLINHINSEISNVIRKNKNITEICPDVFCEDGNIMTPPNITINFNINITRTSSRYHRNDSFSRKSSSNSSSDFDTSTRNLF